MTKSKVTQSDLSRIHSTQSQKTGGNVEKGSFVSRVQRTVETNKKK